MPKTGMEPIRRDALVAAAIREVGARGSANVTVGQIAKAAGVSSALAHHYFGTKDALLISAMRQILRDYGREVRAALRAAEGPRGRVEGIVQASFAPSNFRPEVVSAWLVFYVQALTAPEARRLLDVYQRRLRSNLRHALRDRPGGPDAAETLAALIDGLYLRAALDGGRTSPEAALERAQAAARAILGDTA